MHGADIVLLPRHVAIKSIYADVQNLGIKRGELFAIAIERRQLLGSSRCPVQQMKADYHMLLPAKIAQPDSRPQISIHRRQLEVRRHVSNFQRHSKRLL